MRGTFVILHLALALLLATRIPAAAQEAATVAAEATESAAVADAPVTVSPFRNLWQLGGTMGMGLTTHPGFEYPAMSLTVGFNAALGESRWRLGGELGLINQGIVDYRFGEDDPDRFVRYNFGYAGIVADYSLFARPEKAFNLFVRGGLAPAKQNAIYLYHTEPKTTALGLVGIGIDYYFSKAMITGYITPTGIFTLQFSYGWWFGPRRK